MAPTHTTDLERSFEAAVFAEEQVREMTSGFAPSSAAGILSRKEKTKVVIVETGFNFLCNCDAMSRIKRISRASAKFDEFGGNRHSSFRACADMGPSN